MLLPSERAAFREPGLSAGGLAEDGGASHTQDDRLSVAEHCRDLVATGAFDVHEVGVWALHKALQLALALLLVQGKVQQVLGERHG